MMATPRFNPYRNWLGLDETPNDYYELLGLPVFESDTEQIRTAATRALSTLRSIKPGRRQGRWKALLDQLETARDCLLSADHKRRYDDRLRRKLGASHSPRPAIPRDANPASVNPASSRDPMTDPMAPVEFVRSVSSLNGDPSSHPTPHPAPHPAPLESEHVDRLSLDSLPNDTRSRDTGEALDARVATVSMKPQRLLVGRHKRTRLPASLTLVYAVMVICFVGLFAVFIAVMQWRILPARQYREQRQAALPQSASDLPLPVEDDLTDPGSREPPATSQSPAATKTSLPNVTAAPMDSPTVVPMPDPVIELSPSTRNEINRHLRQSYSAMAQRRWEEAKTSLSEARTLAGQSDLSARVERFTTLNDYVQQYCQAFNDGLEGLAGSELMLQGDRVMVVEANRDNLVLRIQGKNQRFSCDDLPTEVVMMIADRWFDQRAATTRAFRGAFMLITGAFTAEEVRQEWRQAERDGARLDDLVQVLDDLEAVGSLQESKIE